MILLPISPISPASKKLFARASPHTVIHLQVVSSSPRYKLSGVVCHIAASRSVGQLRPASDHCTYIVFRLHGSLDAPNSFLSSV